MIPPLNRPDLRSTPAPLFPSVPHPGAIETDTTQTGIKLTLRLMGPNQWHKKANIRTRDGKTVTVAFVFGL